MHNTHTQEEVDPSLNAHGPSPVLRDPSVVYSDFSPITYSDFKVKFTFSHFDENQLFSADAIVCNSFDFLFVLFMKI